MSQYEWFVTLTAGGLATFLIGGAAFSAHMVRVYERRIAEAEAGDVSQAPPAE